MSQEKGKNLQEPKVPLKNHGPGCMWGIFNHFQHNRWHSVVKRLPGKRHGSRKHSTDQESTRSAPVAAAEVQEDVGSFVVYSPSERKTMEPIPAHKSSMKSRIKALLPEDMYRKKGRHRRSPSCPTRKDTSTHCHDQEKTFDAELPAEVSTSIEIPGSRDSVHSTASFEHVSPKGSKEHDSNNNSSCDLYYLRQSEPNKLGDFKLESPGVQDNTELQKYTKEHSAILKRSVTENGSPEQFSREPELSDNVSPNTLRKGNDNKVVLKGFKTIREKLKYVIRDRKKEKTRIVMDAVHHKVPYGHSVSNKSNDDCSENKPGTGQMGYDFGKSPLQSFKRTSSFNESLNRYNQILEISSNREAKDNLSERSSSRAAETPTPIRKSHPTLGRILSLPDLRSKSYFHIDDSSIQSSDMDAAGNINVAGISNNEHKPLNSNSINKVQICCPSESESQGNLIDFGKTLDESADSKTLDFGQTLNERGWNHELMSNPAPQPSLLDEVLENDPKYQEDEITSRELEVSVSEDTKFANEDSSTIQQEIITQETLIEEDSPTIQQDIISQETITINTQENQLQQFYKHLVRIKVDTTNEAQFNYVKEIVELSGFSSNEIIGKWHPLVFGEIEGGLIDHQECCANEEDKMCNHLLLFDLVNEVLLDIHERSFCYWPTPLTDRCHVHQLPKGGYHVLEGVWSDIKWLLSWKPENEQDGVSRDLSKHDDWMNLQMDAECAGLELEDMIFDDLLDEITYVAPIRDT